MNVEEIKELSKKVNQVTRNMEIMVSYMDLLSMLVSNKQENIQDKGMVLYLALKKDGMLQLLQNQLESMIDTSNEADNFIYKVAEKLETKKIVANHGGKLNGK
ncbi:hypothetical protein ACFFIF_08070 [Vagococcus entomophilus]|uniref:Uncharacterized protein n=1 Tax=Vagococcus entomophilus TaxID=1160095 RepID=A0A430AH78_9ENTE|nr:hypothetical protein [Vagococcus entomophilus]RSU07282.1 hypothetical protein CBF30_08500 [Vagococcus entomophilus]